MTGTGDFERQAFEIWLCERPDYWGRNLAEREEDGTYKYGEVENHWLAWQARAALASPSADHMEDVRNMVSASPLSEELPPLPHPQGMEYAPNWDVIGTYTADQMREYALSARALSRTAPEGDK
jgi:hypothetical protein